MFNLSKIFNKISKDEIARLLNTNKELLEQFEHEYKRALENDDFITSAQQAKNLLKNNEVDINLVNQIVEELISQTSIYNYPKNSYSTPTKLIDNNLSEIELNKLPLEIRPQLTGYMLAKDCPGNNYLILLDLYKKYLDTNDKHLYHSFRQGLDILDLDKIMYEMLSLNQNSISYWLPKIADIPNHSIFKIPNTTIIKVPLTLLQLTRMDYFALNSTTMTIANEFCKRAFNLDTSKEYFIKTGTYSSKFDFRNAHISDPNEISEIGQYLLWIQFQATSMAHYNFENNGHVIYGVSTTNDWCVREYIKDEDHNPTIYNGLPLHTEYRAFVDFNNNEILGIYEYWDKNLLQKRFSEDKDADTPQMKHDYVTFTSCYDKLHDNFIKNKHIVYENLKKVIPSINLKGHWSIDIMQNGNDFWLIDMAVAENSALYHKVPVELRILASENWIPDLSNM